MNFTFVDHASKDRSGVVRALIRISRLLPNIMHETVMWRISKQFVKWLRIPDYKGQPAFTSWGNHVSTIGNGRMNFSGSFAIGNNAYFEIHGPCLVDIADRVRLDTGVMIYAYTGEVHLHERVYIGPYCFLQSESQLTIGADTMIGPRTNILGYTRSAETGPIPYSEQEVTSKGIHIGSNVWIGAGVTILDGVHIGDHAVVGAGAVVTKNVAPSVIVAGIPAKFIRNV